MDFSRGINYIFLYLALSLTRFPFSKPALLKEWIRAVKRKDFQPTIHHFLCSNHFSPECFQKNYINCKRLQDDAVPTIFDFPSQINKEVSNYVCVSLLSTLDVEMAIYIEIIIRVHQFLLAVFRQIVITNFLMGSLLFLLAHIKV